MESIQDRIASTCEQVFPRGADYRIQPDQLRGIVRGVRFRVCRGGFVGQVSVQSFATGGNYRRADPGSMQLRVDGRVRMETAAPQAATGPVPKMPLALLAFEVVMACVIASMTVALWISETRAADGNLVESSLYLATGLIVIVVSIALLLSARWVLETVQPRRERDRRAREHEEDRRRWSALREQLERLMPADETLGSPPMLREG